MSCGLVVPGRNPAERFEGVEAAFDGVASAVDLAVAGGWPTATSAPVVPVPFLVGLLRDGVADAASSHVGAEAAGAVGLVGDDVVRSAAWMAAASEGHSDAFQQGLRTDVVVALARSEEDRQGSAAAVAGRVNFGGRASAGSAQGVIVWFVLPLVPPFGRWRRAQRAAVPEEEGPQRGTPRRPIRRLYQERNTVECLINKLKAWGGVASRTAMTRPRPPRRASPACLGDLDQRPHPIRTRAESRAGPPGAVACRDRSCGVSAAVAFPDVGISVARRVEIQRC